MGSNGRIYIPTLNIENRFKLHDKISQKTTSYTDALIGNWSNSELSLQFFSEKNINVLNNNLIKGVQQQSNNLYTIGIQDQDQLKTIMRSIYLENAKNLSINIPEQINVLNSLVLQYSIPQIISSLKSYNKYMHDITNMYVPMDRPIYSNINNKTLEFKGWF